MNWLDMWMERRSMAQLRIMLVTAYSAVVGGWSTFMWAVTR